MHDRAASNSNSASSSKRNSESSVASSSASLLLGASGGAASSDNEPNATRESATVGHQLSLKSALKHSLTYMLPHVSLWLVFAMYALFGAAILSEMESTGPANKRTVVVVDHRLHHTTTTNSGGEYLTKLRANNKQLNKLLVDLVQRHNEALLSYKELTDEFSQLIEKSLSLKGVPDVECVGEMEQQQQEEGGEDERDERIHQRKKRKTKEKRKTRTPSSGRQEADDEDDKDMDYSVQFLLNLRNGDTGIGKLPATRGSSKLLAVLEDIAKHLVNWKQAIHVEMTRQLAEMRLRYANDYSELESEALFDDLLVENEKLLDTLSKERTSRRRDQAPISDDEDVEKDEGDGQPWAFLASFFLVNSLLTSIGNLLKIKMP